MILKLALIPIQDDPETRGGKVGVLWPGASTHAERREPDCRADQRVFESQRRHRVYGPEPGGDLHLDRADVDAAGIQRAEPKATRSDPGGLEQGHRAESGADHAAGASIRADRKSRAEALPAAPLSAQVPAVGHCAADGSGPGARASEWAGDAVHLEARASGVRQERLCAAGGNLGIPSVQLAGQPAVPQTRGDIRKHAPQPGLDRGTAQARPARPAWISASGHGASRGLEAMLHQFPFRILGFHADNGSEFINHTVAQLLEKLRVEFTKSRAYRTTDNALVEGKNGAIVRKHIGYGHIAAEHAETLQKFYTAHLNPYLNFHRPCGFATVSLDARGKRKRRYPREDYATPYQKLKSLEQPAGYLKEGISFDRLDRWARSMSDTECAKKMSAAKAKLLRACKSESPIPPPRFL